jgi:hypothetical protein
MRFDAHMVVEPAVVEIEGVEPWQPLAPFDRVGDEVFIADVHPTAEKITRMPVDYMITLKRTPAHAANDVTEIWFLPWRFMRATLVEFALPPE